MSSDARRRRAAALHDELDALGVDVWINGEALSVKAPRGLVGPELRARLRELKPELIALLREHATPPQPARGHAPLTGPQRQLWFAEHLGRSPGAHEVRVEIELRGPLDRHALDRALAGLLSRHAALRTRFETREGVAISVVDPPARLDLDRPQTIDLRRGPVFTAALQTRGPAHHLLELRVHHIVFDGRSVLILLDELGRLYAGEALGPAPPDAAEIARALVRREAQPGVRERIQARARAIAELEPIDASLGLERPASTSDDAAHLSRRLAPSRWAAITKLARRLQLTPATILLAATALVLGRWAGRERLCLGVPTSWRADLDHEAAIGNFVDMALVTVELGGAPRFVDLLARVKAAMLAALADADLPLDRVLSAAPSRPRAGSIPNVTFNYVPFGAASLDLDRGRGTGLRAEVRATMPGARFDLTIYAIVRDQTLWLEAALRREVFEPAQIEAMLAQIEAVLDQALAEPEAACAGLRLTRRGRAEAPPPSTLAPAIGARGLLAAISAVDRERVALVAEGRSLDYGTLRASAAAYAGVLARAGMGPGACVVIFARRQLALAPALLAIWAVGACVAILDADHPPGYLASALAELRANAVIDMGPLLSTDARLHAARATLLELPPLELPGPISGSAPVAARPTLERDAELRDPPADALAHVVFTSGTTRIARAVAADHRPLRQFLADYGPRLEFGPEFGENERVSLLSGLSHDPVFRDLLVPLYHGASCHLPPAEPAVLGARLGAWLRAEAITTVHLTPSLARMIAATTKAPLPALRRVCFGGDVVRGGDLERWFQLARNAKFYNFYGTSETPQAVAMHTIGDHDRTTPIIPIGRGIDGVELELVDAEGQPTAIGELGEIVVRSDFLARGYLDELRDGASSGPSGSDPSGFGRTGFGRSGFGPGPRFRTGDLGRLRADGSVAFVGRRDDQVEIRGERVELAAIEAELVAIEGVAEAGVVTRVDTRGEAELVAWLVGVEPSELARVRACIRARLPAALAPSQLGLAHDVPRSRRGKLDRRALARAAAGGEADWILARPELVRELARDLGRGERGELPDTSSERVLAQLWSALLGVSSPRRGDDFFELGGHSLLALTAVAQIADATGVELPVATLFEHPTLAGLAAALDRAREGERAPPQPTPAGQRARASIAQERLWMLEQIETHAPQLQVVHELRFDAGLDLDRFDRALVACEARHELLRARFEWDADELWVHVLPARAQVLERASEAVTGEVRVDLARGPCWRVITYPVQGAQGGLAIHLVLHHIIADAASMEVLVGDLVELYEAALDGRPARLADLPLRYVDVAAWQRAGLRAMEASRSDDAQGGPIGQRLAGLAPLPLPIAVTRRPARQGRRGRRLHRGLSPTCADALQRACAQAGATVFMVTLTALTAVLARWTGTPDIAVGTPVGLRPHSRAEGVVGPFLGLITLRLDASGAPSLTDLLGRVRAETLGALALAEVPFEAVLRACDPPRELGRTPLFQVLFNVVDVASAERSWARIGATRLAGERADARYDLSVYLLRRASGDELAVVYDADLFVEAQAEQLLDHLEATLLALANAPACSLAELALLPPEPQPPEPQPPDFIASFIEIAEAHPSAPAVATAAGTVSYAELLDRVRALATVLSKRELGPRLGVIVGRDAELAVALLGVLASGRAYVPLDPALPQTRLRELALDAQLSTIVCSASELERARALAGELGLAELVVIGLEPVPAHGALPAYDPAAVAYLLYTSGSTGRAKAVIQSRANLARHARSYAASVGLGPGDRVSLLSTYAFDAAVMDIYGALGSGACLCVLERGPQALLTLPDAIRDQAINVVHGTPTVIRELIAGLAARLVDDGDASVEAVRAVVLGGEEARVQDAIEIRRQFPRATIVNGLGPTECTLALQHQIPASDSLAQLGRDPAASLPIGRPVAGLRVQLRTEIGEQPALYGIGELTFEGPQIARGYWRRPELDASSFPIVDGVRRYRSGDLGRRLADGTFVFAGRRDAQLELRGHRIEPGEIEARLRACPGVGDAAIVLHREGERERLVAYVEREGGRLVAYGEDEDEDEGGRLAAYVGPRAARDPIDAQALLARLREQLPSAMVPSALVFVDALPRSATGKIDRRALARRPLAAEASARGDQQRPATAAERRMLELWSSALGERVERLDLDLFACGGDSLTAVRLARALEREYARPVPLALLFTGHDVASLTAWVDGRGQRGTGAPARGLRARVIRPDARDDTDPVFVCVLPPGGRPRMLDALGAALDSRLWTLEPPSLAEEGPLPSLAEIVSACADALAELGPLAPARSMWVGGVSNGGLIALELAREFHRRGRPPDGVFLLDSIPPELLARAPWHERSLGDRLATFAVELCGPDLRPSALDAIQRAAGAANKADAFVGLGAILSEAGVLEATLEPAELEAMARRHAWHAERAWRLSSAFVPTPPACPVDLFEAREPGRWPRPLAPLWRRHLSRLRVHEVPGDHRSMLGRAHAPSLARALCRAAACAKL